MQSRDYRDRAVPAGLMSFKAAVAQTDLWIAARRDLTELAIQSIRRHRSAIEDYIRMHPAFARTLTPWPHAIFASPIVERMVQASLAVGVGPMASVAGAIAQAVAEDISPHSDRILVENGGDLFLIGDSSTVVGLWAGTSPLSGQFGLALHPGRGISVCTSSGTVGPSLSFGMTDCATVISRSGALADAAATELGNRVKVPDDIAAALDWALSVKGVLGAAVIMGDVMGAKGEVELVPIKKEEGIGNRG